jgi:hypothetical protein
MCAEASTVLTAVAADFGRSVGIVLSQTKATELVS